MRNVFLAFAVWLWALGYIVNGQVIRQGGGGGNTTSLSATVSCSDGTSSNVDSNTLYVDCADNRVGLGTTDPLTPIDVNGAASIRGQVTVAGSSLSVSGNAFSVGTSSFAITGSSVGIRTTSPSAALHVAINGSDTGAVEIGFVDQAVISANSVMSVAGSFNSTGAIRGCDSGTTYACASLSHDGTNAYLDSTYLNAAQNTPIIFRTSVSGTVAERMRLGGGATRGLTVTDQVTAVSSMTITGGLLGVWSRTRAQIDSITPTAVGAVLFCSDCTVPNICVSTAATASSFLRVDSTTVGCGTNN